MRHDHPIGNIAKAIREGNTLVLVEHIDSLGRRLAEAEGDLLAATLEAVDWKRKYDMLFDTAKRASQ